MCRSVRVRLSPAEHKQTLRLSGILLPVYASIALVILAGVYVAHSVRTGDTMAAALDAATSAVHSAER